MITTGWRDTLDDAELAEVRDHVEAVAVSDAVTAYAEPATMDLATGGAEDGTRHLLARDATGVLVGYAHVDARHPDDVVVEFAVRPEHRRHGVGATMADLLLAELPTARAWAHGDGAAAGHLAASCGLRRDRELWEMRRGPEAGPLPTLRVPDGVVIRPLRVGTDEEGVVAVNNRAFAWHPEQSGWTLADVRHLEAESWFDADGVLLAWDDARASSPSSTSVASAEERSLLGFHWTKVHQRSASVPEPLGEVYVVGVDPSAQGRHVGTALTLAGLHHLAQRGLDTVILYVEGDNAAAIATYRHLGFEQAAVDVSYRR